MPKVKFYAVRRGREGPRIYSTWSECCKNIEKFPNASHKSFKLYEDAVMWLNEGTASNHAGRTSQKGRPDFVDLTEDDDIGVENAKKELDEDVLMMSQYPELGVHSAPIDLTGSDDEVISWSSSDGDPMGQDESLYHDYVPQTKLSPEQQAVLDRVKNGYSVFFTGSAGTGKSVLLREIIRMQGGSPSDRLGITASTGIAAINIGGTTLHSWAGIGLGKEPAKKLADKVMFYEGLKLVHKRWRKTRTLIIDEISMIDGKLFEKLEEVARIIRENTQPFGGIQLVLCGDFCQLPPVPDRIDRKIVPATFAFDSKCWYDCVGEPMKLTRVFRQKDESFVDMLNEMRFGRVSPKTVRIFKGLSRDVHYVDGVEPTELFPHRNDVDRANERRLHELKGDTHVYISTDIPGFDSAGKEVPMDRAINLLDRLVAQRELKLRIGAQVMLIKNLVQGRLVNGSVGKVIEFSTLRDVELNNPGILISDDPQREGNQRRPYAILGTQWPIVQFSNGMKLVCVPREFTVDNASQGMEASRAQVPLILAWALSVHKSQGQTLERVKVNLARTFEKGQAYVALSRATKLETLQVLHFDPARVLAHPRVLEWMEIGNKDDSEDSMN